MPDQSDETQKQQRRSTASPPFFAPRTTRPPTPSQSTTATPGRRTLFTPPGVTKQQPAPFKTPLATPRVTPFASPVVASPPPPPPLAIDTSHEPPPLPLVETRSDEIGTTAPAPNEATGSPNPDANAAVEAESPPNAETPREEPQATRTPDADDGFVIERYETPPIALNATGEQGIVSDDPSMAFQVYDDASRLLERGARPVPPEADGLEIERTEVTFEASSAEVAPLEVESFWAPQTMPEPEAPSDADTPPLGNESVAEARGVEPASEPPLAQPPSPQAAAEPMASPPLPPAAIDSMPVPSWLDDAPAASAPLAGKAIEPPAPAMPQAPDDADEALAEAFAEPAPNESVPRWATPRMVPAIEQGAPLSRDAWGAPAVSPPPDELAAALAWPDSGLRARTPAAGVAAIGDRGDTSHELAASAEGWPLSVSGRPAMPDAIAEALERIAQRVRAGDVPLPADVALAKSDESALALTLAALLRVGAASRA